MRKFLGPLAFAVAIVAASVSCGNSPGADDFTSAGDASPPESGTNLGSAAPGTFGDASLACGSGNAVEGCACPKPGTTGACWTGPADQRNVGACHDGTSLCSQQGEFSDWGPCQGEQLNCGVIDAAAPPSPDSGTSAPIDSGGGSTTGCAQTTCACVPGSVIDCDEDCSSNVYCSSSAQKTCLPDGTWGACKEVTTLQPTTCKVIGTGCTSSASCNSGQGVFLGDCAGVFTCNVPVLSGSTAACGNNGVWTVVCNCSSDGTQQGASCQ
jgi:hypothetical protein